MASNLRRTPLVFSSGFNAQILSDLYEAAEAGQGTDMKFELGSEGLVLTAHSAVIRSQSKVLDVMINETWAPKKQKQEIVVKLPADDFEEFKLFIKFLYGNQELSEPNINVDIPVWKLADKYGADNVLTLFAEYFEFLLAHLAEVDVCKIVLVAHKHDCETLLNAALTYVKMNLDEFWFGGKTDWYEWPLEILTDILCTDRIQTLLYDWNKNEYHIVLNVVKWLCNYQRKHTCTEPEMKAVATKVFECVRFFQLDHENFRTCMSQLYIFLTDEQISIITLVRFGVPEQRILARYGPELAFKVDRRMRNTSDL